MNRNPATKGRRAARVAPQIHEVLSRVLLTDVRDPGLANVVFTEVTTSPDLRVATVHYVGLTDDVKRDDAEAALKRCSGHLRRYVGEFMRLRYTPELRFRYDERGAHLRRIEQVIQRIHAAEAAEAPAPPEDGGPT